MYHLIRRLLRRRTRHTSAAARRAALSRKPGSPRFEQLEPRLLLSADGLTGGLTAPPDEAPDERSIVMLREDADAQAFARQAAQAGAQVDHVYNSAINGVAMRGPVPTDDPSVVSVEPDRQVFALGQNLPTGVDRIEGDQNDVAQIDGADQRVDADIAVIDTGIDRDHPDLNVETGRNFTRGPSWDWDDGNGHGTHVAGTAAALDNSKGVVGMAPGADLWAAKVLNDDGSGRLSDVIKGIDWVTDNADQIEAANLSLGVQGQSDSFRSAIQDSVGAGVFYSVAAGNSSMDVYGGDGTLGTSDDIMPAAYPEVATVTAMADSDGQPGGNGPDTSYGSDDSFASFTNFSQQVVSNNPVSSPGKAIDLLVPGVEITSTWKGGGTATKSGTSMAAPHVAGLAALEYAGQGTSDLNGDGSTNQDDVHALRQTLIDRGVVQDSSDGLATLDDPDGNREHLGWAVSGAPTVDVTNPNDGDTVSDIVTIKADASDPDGSVSQVEFFVDSNSVGTDSDGSDGWSTDWDSTGVSDGDHSITAKATDGDNNTASDTIGVTVDNVDEAPTVTWQNPADGETVSGTETVQIDADDDRDSGTALTVEWQINDGTWRTANYNSETGLYEDTWETTNYTDGDYNLDAQATDSGGNTSAEERIAVTVDNSASSTDMYVWDMSWQEKVYGPWTDVMTTVDVNQDSNNNGTAESGDDPAANATTTFQLTHDTDGDGTYEPGTDDDSWNATADTDSNGQVTFELKKAPDGDYQGKVTGLTHETLTWNSNLDADNPDYHTVGNSSATALSADSGEDAGSEAPFVPSLRDERGGTRIDALAAGRGHAFGESTGSPNRLGDVLDGDDSEDEQDGVIDLLAAVS